MKNLYIIGGTMGVGKTTTCQILNQKLKNSVFLDGDWCWDMSPFKVTDETKKMVMNNICYLLNNFIKCDEFDNIIFCWVLHEESIIDDILSQLNLNNCCVYNISLICEENELKKRLKKDIENHIREESVIQRSINRLPKYSLINSIKIDVSKITAEEAASKIAALAVK